MIFKRKIAVILAAVLIIGVISGSLLLNEDFISTSARAENIKTVILDAGHGGLTNTTD